MTTPRRATLDQSLDSFPTELGPPFLLYRDCFLTYCMVTAKQSRRRFVVGGYAYFLASGVTLRLTRSPLRSTMTATGLPIFTASIA